MYDDVTFDDEVLLFQEEVKEIEKREENEEIN